ncbi:SoxR reducing system RseC family protein [Nitrogeniibacter mangrovi]|uniref:SoxR reducing system RseC family protein n=1 Tax=Nitrogeniibacter mangrovi TaxID=2016596 RepID=A0A6C1B2H6_9RHOO|nr:SoxR reducing system RseC family protein [Nitrogeniibacter mangrovi]QID17767.1 SoxR reducing system RseC family protein [Nitrogeniibacter mangrovi]
MIEAPGVIERVVDGAVWVRLSEQQGGCGRCHEPGGCGGARIAHALGKPNDVFQIVSDGHWRVGQAVRLVADDGAALTAGLASYGVPTLAAIAGAAVGTTLGGHAGAVVGLVGGLVAAALLVRRLASERGWQRRLSVTIEAASSCHGNALDA